MGKNSCPALHFFLADVHHNREEKSITTSFLAKFACTGPGTEELTLSMTKEERGNANQIMLHPQSWLSLKPRSLTRNPMRDMGWYERGGRWGWSSALKSTLGLFIDVASPDLSCVLLWPILAYMHNQTALWLNPPLQHTSLLRC